MGAAVALDYEAVPVSEVTPAKLMGNPKLTVQLSEQEVKDAQRKARKTSKSVRSTS